MSTCKNKSLFEGQENVWIAYNLEPVRISQVEEAFSAFESFATCGRAPLGFGNLALNPMKLSPYELLDVFHRRLQRGPDG